MSVRNVNINGVSLRVWRGRTLGLLLGAAVTILWVALTMSTGLIFHFHPLLVSAATAWGFNKDRGRKIDVKAVSMSAFVAAVLVGLGALVITEQGHPLDAGWFVVLETAVGVAVGVAIPRRRGRPDGAERDEPDEQGRTPT